MTLAELAALLERFATGAITLAALRATFDPLFSTDPLRVELTDSAP